MLSIAELSRAAGAPPKEEAAQSRPPIPPSQPVDVEGGTIYNQQLKTKPNPPSNASKELAKPKKPAKNGAAAGTIIFVDPISSLSPSDLSKQRQTVRSIAMRTARKERWWSTKSQDSKKAKEAPDGSNANGTQKNGTSRVRKKPTKTASKPANPKPTQSTALIKSPNIRGAIRPYDSIIMNDNHTIRLTDHYIKFVSPDRPQLAGIRHAWFKTAQSNTAFLNTLLCMSAMHLYAMGAGPPELIYYHKGKVISGINANMSNNSLAMSPENLAAVCNLYCIEMSLQRPPWDAVAHLSPTPHKPGVHRQGLRNMVAHRGGLRTLVKDRLVYAYILWLQTLENVSDYFFVGSPSPVSDINGEIAWPGPVHDGQVIEGAAQNEPYTPPPDSQMLPIGHELVIFARDMSRWCRNQHTSYDAADLLIRCCRIQTRLLELLKANTYTTDTEIHETISCIGMLSFAQMATGLVEFNRLIIQDNPAKSKWYAEPRQQAAASLRRSLEFSYGRRINFSNENLVWLHVIGAICSEGQQDNRQWFIEQCPRRVPSVATADAFIRHFLEFGLWIDGPYDDALHKVYREFENLDRAKDVIWQELRHCGGLTHGIIKPVFEGGGF